jgi:hypothetical protein
MICDNALTVNGVNSNDVNLTPYVNNYNAKNDVIEFFQGIFQN